MRQLDQDAVAGNGEEEPRRGVRRGFNSEGAETGSRKTISRLFSQPSATTCPEQFRERRIVDKVRGSDRGAAAAVGDSSGEAAA